jgi:hypothetical protein
MQQTWDELRPARASEWRQGDDGRIDILVPPYGRGRIGQKLQSWFKASSHRVHLDDVGTFVWQRCDGSTPVREIAAAMHDHFGERVEPVEDRLVLFLQHLVRSRFLVVE